LFDPLVTDFCGLSVSIYEKAVESNVEKMLAETEFVGFTKNHTAVYKQEKIKKTESEYHYYSDENQTTPSEKSINTVKETLKNHRYSSWCRFSLDWLASAIDFYGFEYVDNCMKFFDDMQIDDFHQGNYGYRFDGSPVIFDYAGFFWE